MNIDKGLRNGVFFDTYREEESAFKCTFDVGLDGDDEMIGLREVASDPAFNYDEDEDEDEDTGDEVVTKEDMEEMVRLFRQELATDKEILLNLEEEIRKVKRKSIFQRKELLKREVLLTKVKLERYLGQNNLLKGLCFQKMSTSYDQDLPPQLKNILNAVNQDRHLLSSIEKRKALEQGKKIPETEDKYVQSSISDISLLNKNIAKDESIESLYKLYHRLRKKLTEERTRRKSDILEPDEMMVSIEEHRRLVEKADLIKSIVTKSNNSSKKTEPILPNTQSNGDHSLSVSKNGDSKAPEKFYVCKCGQKFVKVDKRMRKMDKNYTGISATTAYSIYRNHFSQCPVYLKDAIMCDVCQDVFYSIPCLKVHIRSKHPDCIDLLEKYKHKYVCLCGRSFKNYSQECTALKALRKHAVSCPVYRSQAILCEICGVPFLEENHLENHIRMAHKDYYSSKKLSSSNPCSSNYSSSAANA